MTELAVPVLLQATDHECGNTCLAAIARFAGRDESTAELAHLAGTTTDGTDHGGMIAAASALGATALTGSGGTLEQLAALIARGLPVIVGWWSTGDGDADHDPAWPRDVRRARDRGHYSVVCAVTPSEIVLMDPEVGRVAWSVEAFTRVWYDTDGDDYHRVDGWFLALDYATARC